MSDMKQGVKGAKKRAWFYVGWIGIPTLIASGSVVGVIEAIAQRSAPAGIASGIAISGLTYILLRRFA